MADPHGAVIDNTRPGHYGAAGSGVTLAEATIAGAWNMQGDPSRVSFVDESQRLLGVALPPVSGTIARNAALAAMWLGPASWLLVTGDTPLTDYAAKRDALNAAGGALFDVSESRVAWSLSGPRAADVLAKGCPLDFHPRAFAPGTCAQSLYGHVNVMIARPDDAPAFVLLVARSFGRETWHALRDAAAPYGFDVTAPAPFR